jgi:AAA domain, putative AbiEii toxin, Type IV TA system
MKTVAGSLATPMKRVRHPGLPVADLVLQPPRDEDWEVALEQAERRAAEALRALAGELKSVEKGTPLSAPRQRLDKVSSALWKKVASGNLAARVANLRPPLYIVDEPERHLHPLIQREVAAWLADAMHTRRSQCVVATHAVPFLNLAGDVSYAYVRRTAKGNSELEAFDPELLTALTQAASELGFNRGELLSSIRVLLFVEGPADQKVLEALFLKRLYAAGIAVFPLHGAVGAEAQILDANVLLRYTTAIVAVALDDLSAAETLRLQTDDAYLNQSLKAKKLTLKEMAKLIKTAKLHGRHIEAYGIPGYDIFDLLDEGVLTTLYPEFPGHKEAAAEHAKHGGKLARKTFYRKRYKIPQGVEKLYVPVADRMAELGRVPLALRELIDEVERYALTL